MTRLAIITTGGTIAMRSTGGAPATVSGQGGDIIAAAPYLADMAEIVHRDALGIPSASFTFDNLATIIRAAEDARDADGIVITHGTDTLQETAFALELAVAHRTPVVLTGAMRRFDQAGADGAANLEAAGLTALSPLSRDKGVLVTLDDEIHWGPLIRKVHAFRTHAFSSAPFGPIGWVAERTVRYALRPDVSFPKLALGPRGAIVPILEAGPGLEPEVVESLGAVADALVLSLPGAGHVAGPAVPTLERLAKRIPVVFASRTGGGRTLASSYGFAGSEADLIARGLTPAGPLDARKARVLLMVLLSADAPRAHIDATFARLP
ncbi:MAG TPA: asparaginase [Caulobacteraceae bacterium]|jgi:L-asparaginase